MQNISLHNYQDFLLRYIDGALDLRETEALLAFVVLHPEAQEELAALEMTKLEAPTISCPNKALLYKNIFPVIVEPETIVYPYKQKLLKKEKDKAPVVLLKWWAMGAAAVFIFMVARYGMFNGEADNGLSKNNVSKNSVTKPVTSKTNNVTNTNSIKNNSIVNAGSLASITVLVNPQNVTTNTLDPAASEDIAHQSIKNGATVTAAEMAQAIPSYNGSIIDVKPTVIAEIMMPSFATNEEATEIMETIDTEAASSNRSVMIGAFEIDKDKFRGLFRKVNVIIKNKENNKNEK